jgi:DNA-binding protein YbaB
MALIRCSNDLISISIDLPRLVDSEGMSRLSIMIMATFNNLDMPNLMIAYILGIRM